MSVPKGSETGNPSSLRQTEHVFPSDAIELTDNSIAPITEGVSVLPDNLLYFYSRNDFHNVMESLVNHEEETLDLWEQNLGFRSLRSYYNQLQEDPDVDDADLDLERIPDVAFESVLNQDRKVRIGDTIYQINYLDKKVLLYSLSGENIGTINIPTAQVNEKTGLIEWNDHQTYCSRINGNYKVRGTKWVKYFGVYASVGTRTTHYKQNRRGKWKKRRASEIHFWLDKWGYLKYYFYNDPIYTYWNPIVRTDVRKSKSNRKKVEHIFDRRYFDKIGVLEYRLTHNWTTDYNKDCHNNTW